MKIEIRNNGIADVTVLVTDERKVLRRIETQELAGKELWLGKSYCISSCLPSRNWTAYASIISAIPS